MLTIGSRGSQLALWQAHWIQERLEELGTPCRIEIIRTTGDKITDVPLARVGSKGLFTKEIEEALLEKRVDLAVHSMKDLPTDLPDGLGICAVPRREDPRDAMAGARLSELPEGARVGTSSLRRSAQLLALRPDLDLQPVRGNVDTRLRKLDEGQYAAIVLAAAGLRRLGWAERITEYLDPRMVCPAVGQGALAVETRLDGGMAYQLCLQLDHETTRLAVECERAILRAFGGGCQVPLGASARVLNGSLEVWAVAASPDGNRLIRHQGKGPAAEAVAIGERVGQALLDEGAAEILAEVYGAAGDSKS